MSLAKKSRPIQSLSDPVNEQQLLLHAFECVIGDKIASYVSGPITTGQAFCQWYVRIGHALDDRSSEYLSSLNEHVVSPNERVLIETARSLRTKQSGIFIEPASLRIPAWKQPHFHRFWVSVLERYVSRIILVDGWQFSVGCAIEFRYGIRSRIRMEDISGRTISLEQGKDQILKAASAVQDHGRSFAVLQEIARTLRMQAESGY
jgi:hypothetical protein